MSPKQSNTSDSLWILQGQGKPFFCRSATWTFLRICRVIIYRGDVTEAELMLTRGLSVTQLTRITICPRHGPLLGRLYRASKSCQVASLAGKHVINFQMAVEICFLFGKTIILLLSDRVSVISFAGFGFFLNRELFPTVRLHVYILFHFTFEFSGGAIPIPRPKLCSNAPS